MITSVQNPLVKQVKDLKRRKARRESGLFRIEGHREIDRALEGNIRFKAVLYCPVLSRFHLSEPTLARIREQTSVRIVETSEQVFQSVSQSQNSEGILAVAEQPSKSLCDLQIPSGFVCLVVEAVEKPGNLGSVFRSADATGCDAVVIADPVVDLYNPNVIRASLGTVFTVPSGWASLYDTWQ